MAGRTQAHTSSCSCAERIACGKAARNATPRSSHAAGKVAPERRDPIALLEEQATTRVPELVPIRYGRMLVSPFAYFRGAALPMAADLATTPITGLTVQLCGDAHLSNFGMFGSPERRLFFDVNDFDETAPGPWEWDLKRLAASLEISGRENDFSGQQRRDIVGNAVRTYREAMTEFSEIPMLDVWYAHLDCDNLLPRFDALLDPKKTPNVWKAISKAWAHDSHQAFEKLVELVDGEPRIVSDPPLIVPIEQLGEDIHSDAGEGGCLVQSARINTRSNPIDGTSSSSTGLCIWHARWSASEASGATPGSLCFWTTAMPLRCSCKSSRRRPPSWSASPRRVDSRTTASAWCADST